jgi:uncharacterized RDD family membrane protein YckC
MELKPESTFASVRLRYAAILIDLLLLAAVFFPVTRVVKGTWVMTSGDHRWAYGWFVTDPLCLGFLVAMGVYFVVLEGFFGATVGKGVIGIRVVRPDQSTPGFRRSFLRNLLRLVDGLPALGILGAYLIATSQERTRLGDRCANTRVVRRRVARLTARSSGPKSAL